jgi:hypothetical protein
MIYAGADLDCRGPASLLTVWFCSGLRGDAWRAGWPGFHGPADDDVHDLSTALMRAVTAAADQAKGETTVLLIDGAQATAIAPYGHDRWPGAGGRDRI